jgi:hypothetical protein
MSSTLRTFTIYTSSTGFEGGCYKSDAAPGKAAKKAARRIFAAATKPGQKVSFTLREMTRGSAKKHWAYEATRKKLPKPLVVKVDDGSTSFKSTHTIHIKALGQKD